jgi:hypothetical protein
LSFSLFFQLSSKKERNQKTKHKTKKDLPIHPSRICWWFSLTCLAMEEVRTLSSTQFTCLVSQSY